MGFNKALAKHYKAVFFGGNWTVTNFQEVLNDITIAEANTKMEGLNTILTLVFHVHYFNPVIKKVLAEGVLEGNDKFSWKTPKITSEQDWIKFKELFFNTSNEVAELIDRFPDEKLLAPFVDKKYKDYFYNINGIIEHLHYHLGQIVILKKLIRKQNGA